MGTAPSKMRMLSTASSPRAASGAWRVGTPGGGAHARDGGQARLAEAGVQLHLLARHVEQPAQVHVGHASAQTAAHHSQVVVVVHRVHRAASAGQHLDQRRLVGDVQLPHGDTVAARPAGDLFRRGGVGVGDRQLDVPLLGEVTHYRPADEAGAPQHYHLQLSVSLRGARPYHQRWMTIFLSVKKSTASWPWPWRTPRNDSLRPPNGKNAIGAASPTFTPPPPQPTCAANSRAALPLRV